MHIVCTLCEEGREKGPGVVGKWEELGSIAYSF